MVAVINTVAFQGVSASDVVVQVQLSRGLPAFTIVGLPDKAVAESRERIRAALGSLGLGFPPKRITVNLAPANVPKEGTHFDLPIALGIVASLEIVPPHSLAEHLIIGELGLDGSLARVNGAVAAGLRARHRDMTLLCPAAVGAEAMLASSSLKLAAASNLLEVFSYLRGEGSLPRPAAMAFEQGGMSADMADVRGQETARRALEVAAAGGHNMLMVGPPGAGKSMLAQRLAGILPPLSEEEAMEVYLVASVSGAIGEVDFAASRPFRAPHHSASMPALVGGGSKARPGEATLAHCGVLFLDELPEFNPSVLDSLRQPLETGEVSLSRANARVVWPASFQLIAAMNPCRCGYANEPGYVCKISQNCSEKYRARISGPLLDRIDIRLDVAAVDLDIIGAERTGEPSALVAQRVRAARDIQRQRFRTMRAAHPPPGEATRAGSKMHLRDTNALASQRELELAMNLTAEAKSLLVRSSKSMGVTARGHFRIMRVARTIADLAQSSVVAPDHVAEAFAFRGFTH